MGINWDQHLLAPLHGVFGDPVEYRHGGGAEPYTISGIFDRAYTQEVEPLDDGSTINTTKPVLGVRDSQFGRRLNRGPGIGRHRWWGAGQYALCRCGCST